MRVIPCYEPGRGAVQMIDLRWGVIDLLILSLLAWGGIIGWRRGGFRSLLDCMGVGSAIAAVIFSIPSVYDQLIDASWAFPLRKWLFEHMRTVEVGLGLSRAGTGNAENLYHLIIVGACALAIWGGIQMILQVFQTVLKEPSGSLASRITGTFLGTCVGGVLAVYMVQCLGLLSWIQGWEALDFYLSKSFFVWTVMSWIVG